MLIPGVPYGFTCLAPALPCDSWLILLCCWYCAICDIVISSPPPYNWYDVKGRTVSSIINGSGRLFKSLHYYNVEGSWIWTVNWKFSCSKSALPYSQLSSISQIRYKYLFNHITTIYTKRAASGSCGNACLLANAQVFESVQWKTSMCRCVLFKVSIFSQQLSNISRII